MQWVKRLYAVCCAMLIMCGSGISVSALDVSAVATASTSSSGKNVSVPVVLVPIVVPTAVVGGLILKSRKKIAQTNTTEYKADEFKLTTSQDTSIGTDSTVEDEGVSKCNKTSYVRAATTIVEGKAVLAAITEAISNNKPNGGTEQ